jgi:pyrroline-5-carboxylate reductase
MRLLLVGCGKMGGALLSGWLERGLAPGDAFVVEPVDEAAGTAAEKGVARSPSADGIPVDFQPDVVVFAVKPQSLDATVGPYGRFAGPGAAVFLTIAAGKPIAYFEDRLGAAAVVRAMPNTPAAVGRGISVLVANDRVDDAQRQACWELMGAVGEVAWIDDEALMDAVTAVSGSGPAYLFLLSECLAEAGVAAGLPAALAATLTRATLAGAGELMRLSDDDAAQLRRNVASPGGTTEAALNVLMAENGLAPLMVDAVAAATRRSRELAG